MKDRYIELAKKLKALADKGVDGEKINAKIKLDRLMIEHGITKEDIDGVEIKLYWFNVKLSDVSFFWQIVGNVTGTSRNRYNNRLKRTKKGVECTPAEAIEIDAKFKFYSSIYKKELKIFYSAFIQTNELYRKKESDDNDTDYELTEEDRRIIEMAAGMKKHSFAKQLKA